MFTVLVHWTAALGPAQTNSRPPNIVLILVDDLDATDLQFTGSDYHLTPVIDQLAAEGMRFTQAYAAAPVCSPTRAAILTGQYPARRHRTGTCKCMTATA